MQSHKIINYPENQGKKRAKGNKNQIATNRKELQIC